MHSGKTCDEENQGETLSFESVKKSDSAYSKQRKNEREPYFKKCRRQKTDQSDPNLFEKADIEMVSIKVISISGAIAAASLEQGPQHDEYAR